MSTLINAEMGEVHDVLQETCHAVVHGMTYVLMNMLMPETVFASTYHVVADVVHAGVRAAIEMRSA